MFGYPAIRIKNMGNENTFAALAAVALTVKGGFGN
jgi:hypothetical protein